MSFEDLPTNVRDLSLIDQPHLMADVVDLMPGDRDRACRSELLLLCDEEGRALQPVVVNDLPRRPTTADAQGLAQMLAHFPDLRVVIAVGDRQPHRHVSWLRDLATEIARVTRQPPLGTFVAVLNGPVEAVGPVANVA